MLIVPLSAWAQITDDFSDNDLYNPAWSGNTGNFTVTSGMLRSNGPAASSNIYISIPFNILSNNMEWRLLVDLSFAPSTTNYVRIYLAADNIDLRNASLSGYFLQIRKGTSFPKTIDFYKKSGPSETVLFTGAGVCFTSPGTNYSNVRIRVTKDETGLWSVYSDCTGGTNYNLDGSFRDNSVPNTTVFGFNCIYSTASRYNQYYFDDFYVGPVQTVTSPPVITTPSSINYKDIIINELMADPSPAVGLPEIEYIELYNRTNVAISIKNFTLTDGTVDRHFTQAVTIEAKGYLVICNSASNKALLEAAIPGVRITSLSGLSLSNDKDSFVLKDVSGKVVDEVSYTNKWYGDNDKADGGWALERIDPSYPCSAPFNWMASINNSGGTPGSQNSVFINQLLNHDPKISGLSIIPPNQIKIAFNGPMDSISLKRGHYLFSSGIISAMITPSQPGLDTLSILLSANLQAGKNYLATITGLKDCSQQLLNDTTLTFGTGRKPEKDEVVINEILADETPSAGLPEAEFLEVYNLTDQLLDLSGLLVKDLTSAGKIPSGTLINPHEYIILCSTSHINDFKPYGKTYGVTSFPSLNSTNESISLTNPMGDIISKVNYNDSWYGDAIKKDGGWSLEKVDPGNPCGGATNWTASVNALGGTPGKQNSVYALNPDLTDPALVQAIAISADTLQLFFSEPIDSLSVLSARFQINDNRQSTLQNISADNIKLKIVPSFTNDTTYTIEVSGISDCVGNFMSNNKASFNLTSQGDSLDVVINEVLFNPFTGGADFVEVYNNSRKYINLKNWHLANLSTAGNVMANIKLITSLNEILKPHQYRVFTTDKQNIVNNYPKSRDSTFIQLSSMPTYNDDEGTVFLINNHGGITDRFDYSSAYHNKLLEKKEGVSLERIGFALPTNNPASWTSAAASVGFATPGYQNSQQQNFVVSGNPVSIEPKVFTPDQDGLFDFTTISFKTDGIGKIGSIVIYDMEGREVRKLLRNEIFSNYGQYQWDGSDDNGHKARIGYYMVYIELFDLKGNINTYKEKVIIAAKF